MSDPYDLHRFVAAQDQAYAQVRAELAAGRKTTHWMWFIFPQISGLGQSAMARRYAISGLDEARAYAGHGVLGPRLRECTTLVLGHAGTSARAIFGSPDDMKLRSCMTLFHTACPDTPSFPQVLDRFYAGKPDENTLALL